MASEASWRISKHRSATCAAFSPTMAIGTPLGATCMKSDKPLPSIPGCECRSGISTPVTYHVVGEIKHSNRRIRAWRSPDVEQQSAEWRKAHMRQIEESDIFW